jgi:hypothetical protein
LSNLLRRMLSQVEKNRLIEPRCWNEFFSPLPSRLGVIK